MEKVFERISAEAFEEAAVKDYEPMSEVEWNGIKILVKKNLTLKEVLSFVDFVAKCCFDEDTGEYMPEIKDFAIMSEMVEKYTNVTLPDDPEKRYDLLCRSGIYNVVLDEIDTSQYSLITVAIDEKVSNMAQARIEASAKRIEEITSGLMGLQEKVGNVFDGIGEGDIKSMVNVFSKGVIDEDKLVKAVVENRIGKVD